MKTRINRQQRRQAQREEDKIKKKMYTYEECKAIATKIVRQTQKEYDARYSICLATSLSAPPLNFGKKRVCRTIQLFFDQVDALRDKIITEEEIRKEAQRVGLFVREENDMLAVYIDPTLKFNIEDGVNHDS